MEAAATPARIDLEAMKTGMAPDLNAKHRLPSAGASFKHPISVAVKHVLPAGSKRIVTVILGLLLVFAFPIMLKALFLEPQRPLLSPSAHVNPKVISTTSFRTKRTFRQAFARRSLKQHTAVHEKEASSEWSTKTTSPLGTSALPNLLQAHVPKCHTRKPQFVTVKSDVERPRVLIISAIQNECTTAMGDDVVLRGLKNKVDYARLHGMDVEHCSVDVPMEPSEDRQWHKLAAIQEKMRSFPAYDWYVWLDYDSVITDMTFDIPWKTYSSHSLVIWGQSTALYTGEKLRSNMISTSTMYVRNNEISRRLLDRVMELCKSGSEGVSEMFIDKPRKPTLNDQSALVYVLSTEQQLWRQHVYLENNYDISHWWGDVSDRLEEYYSDWRGEGQFPPFILNFSGCEFCIDEPQRSPRCVKDFHRGVRFAENQILGAFNMTHTDLDSAEVVHLTASMS
ncbi:hypothetical protein CBR_g50229 [Chara braunii]|uniref:GT34-family glycosyltransferase n=1 Tax=Chara braunii TaxID=69332 RepID=A0A388M6K3_CHABU|nr:hypothetical protein CBR_g50229 [Chara braunii]|eukprot:GBG90135.1 hypothetical protein CBR_g50229 [Chara braunii]